jgi:hypothetical protein
MVMTQADMWDVDGKDTSHLANYEPIVSNLASHASAYGKPVLLLNGDSHLYRSDNPLVKASSCTGDADVCAGDAWDSHPTYDVPNFHRIVVHGSTVPLEWLRLTIDPRATASGGTRSERRTTVVSSRTAAPSAVAMILMSAIGAEASAAKAKRPTIHQRCSGTERADLATMSP